MNNNNLNNEQMLDDKGQIYFDSNINQNFNQQMLKETYKQDIAQVTQSMKNVNTNLNYKKAGEYINNKKKQNK